MRPAILWLDENGGELLKLTIVIPMVSAAIGMLTAAFAGYPLTVSGFLRGMAVGDGIVTGIILVCVGIASAWIASVEWAKAPPRRSIQQPIIASDDYLKAAQREVEAIAPENP